MNNLDVYMSIREQMKTGDMLEWASNGIVGKIIRWRSGPYSHTSGIIRMSEYEGLERRRFAIEAAEKGLVLTVLSTDLKKYDGHCWWYPLKEDWNPMRQGIGEKALAAIGTPYDFQSLFKNALGHVSADAKRLFCSEAWYIFYGFKGKAPTPSEMPKLGIFKEPVQII
jgi:hypothetical protein